MSQVKIVEKCYLCSKEKEKYQIKRLGDNKVGNAKIKMARKQYRGGQGQYIMKREMDQVDLLLCDVLGKIFEQSITREECSSNIFIRRFMNSKFVSRMDNLTKHDN